jgi:hypothetical protein
MKGTGTGRTQISKIVREEGSQGLLFVHDLEECAVHYHSYSTV